MPSIREALLENTLRRAKFGYYHSTPTMTDPQYDALEDELRKLNPSNPVLTETGAPANLNSPWPQARHAFTMTSLSKAMNMQEFRDWWSSNRISSAVLTEKRDGLSLALTYNEGKLVQAVVRGDGLMGDDITPNVLKMQNVPHIIPHQLPVVVHGEVEMTQTGLDKARHCRPSKNYANCRNTASGLSREKEGQLCNLLQVTTYGVYDSGFKTEREKFDWLQKQGFVTAPPHQVVSSPEEVEAVYLAYQTSQRSTLGYDIDGLVIRTNDVAAFEDAGLNAEGKPLLAIALKFPPRVVETTIRNIRWDMGDSGRLTPIAEVDPVPCDGATIRNVSLYNLDFLLQHQVTIGARVQVERRGDIIPNLVSVLVPGPQSFWIEA